MNLELSAEARELGRVVSSAIHDGGGDAIVREVEADPETRHERVDSLLGALGVWDLLPRHEAIELEAAAEVCRAAGWYALPYPLAERLSRLDDEHDLAIVVDGDPLRANVRAVPLRMEAVTMDGRRAEAHPIGDALDSKLGTMVATLSVGPWRAVDGDVVCLPLVLSAWSLLGMTERAFELARRHVLEREQFGRRLADFQAVQFQLTDAAVALQGLQELAKYALWSLHADPSNAWVDALALRAAALDAAAVVFRIAHQLHGAVGFCDEHPLSWLSRHSQPLRRLPLGTAATEAALALGVDRSGLRGLFDRATASYASAASS